MGVIPQATQSYKAQNQPSNRILRSATCPEHNKPGIYRAVQPSLDGGTYWAFACSYLGPKKIHIFVAKPDPKAPTTPEDMAPWIRKQEQLKLQKAIKGS